jgi:hypothetical protein
VGWVGILCPLARRNLIEYQFAELFKIEQS